MQEQLKNSGVEHEVFDVQTKEGLAEAAWHSLLEGHEMVVPQMVIVTQIRNSDNTLKTLINCIRTPSSVRALIKELMGTTS